MVDWLSDSEHIREGFIPFGLCAVCEYFVHIYLMHEWWVIELHSAAQLTSIDKDEDSENTVPNDNERHIY